jgi:hypothetical protein
MADQSDNCEIRASLWYTVTFRDRHGNVCHRLSEHSVTLTRVLELLEMYDQHHAGNHTPLMRYAMFGEIPDVLYLGVCNDG